MVTTIQRLPQRVIEIDPSQCWDKVSWSYCPGAVAADEHCGCTIYFTNHPTVDQNAANRLPTRGDRDRKCGGPGFPRCGTPSGGQLTLVCRG